VVCVAIIFFALGNVIVNGVSGTGSTQVAFYLELLTLFFYVSYIYYTAIYNPQTVEVVWMSEFVYWSLIGGLGYLFLRKGKWHEKSI
jgi:Na+-driven multidrug efflux pump